MEKEQSWLKVREGQWGFQDKVEPSDAGNDAFDTSDERKKKRCGPLSRLERGATENVGRDPSMVE